MADFNEFYEISNNSLSSCPKITFLGLFKNSQIGLSYAVPVPYVTHTCNLCGAVPW